MSKEKAIELIKDVKHSLFLVKSMLYIRDEDTLVEKEPAAKRRVVREEPTTQGRRTSGSGYKVINKTEETSSKK